ncbi:hypothetical protein GBP346_A3092 [Burkholderia pseudomallei MSHR346]|nr:hypothetical protein GBP346_A3092 [Burkholderia pseudomallei MSHR346]
MVGCSLVGRADAGVCEGSGHVARSMCSKRVYE